MHVTKWKNLVWKGYIPYGIPEKAKNYGDSQNAARGWGWGVCMLSPVQLFAAP